MNRAFGFLKRMYPVRLAQAYSQSQSSYYAGTLAFNAFISMFPLMLGLLAIIGLVLRSPQAQSQVQTTILGFFPADAHSALRHTLRSVQQHPGILGILSIVGMLWSGSSLFATMEFVLGRVLGVQPRGFLRQRGMAIAMTAVFMVAILVSILVNTVLALVKGIPFISLAIGAVIWIAFMLTIYRWVPNRAPKLTEVWPGAVLAGVLMEVLTLVWPLYARFSHGFNTYGSTFALFFLLAGWLYLWSQFTILGAVANRMRTEHSEAEGVIHEPAQGRMETEATHAADRQAGRARDLPV